MAHARARLAEYELAQIAACGSKYTGDPCSDERNDEYTEAADEGRHHFSECRFSE